MKNKDFPLDEALITMAKHSVAATLIWAHLKFAKQDLKGHEEFLSS